MKNKRNVMYSLMIIFAGIIKFPVYAQQRTEVQDIAETKELSTSKGPKGIVRTIKKDSKGNIWITSWDGIFKYDGKSFTNITNKVSSARFFSVLEDRKGSFWFATIGAGVYYYNGKSFWHFTIKDGLASDRVTNIYEDKAGVIWFGTDNGVSRYNGKSFQNLKMNEAPAANASDSVHVSAYQHPLPEGSWMHNDVNAIIEDKTGKFWFGTRGYAVVYNGKKFTTITNNDGQPFKNVRSIIKDTKGNIWLGGADGLWRYDGKTFINFSQKFVGYIYEDKKGNIWTSSEGEINLSRILVSNNDQAPAWVLSRYDEKLLLSNKPNATEITQKPMLFGILEDDKGNIWFGAMDGVYRYDGNNITAFKGTQSEK